MTTDTGFLDPHEDESEWPPDPPGEPYPKDYHEPYPDHNPNREPGDPNLPPGEDWVREFQDSQDGLMGYTTDNVLSTVASSNWFTLTPTQFYARGDANAEQIESLLWELGVTHRSIHFWIGDALLYCEARFGDTWSQYVPDLPVYALKTMQNDMWVCRAIEPSRRREKLSFGHHAVVAALDPELQDNFLSMAEELNHSVSTLSYMVTVSKRGSMPKPISLARALKADLRLRVEHLYEGLSRISSLPDPTGLIALEISKIETPPRALRPDVVYRAWSKVKTYHASISVLKELSTETRIRLNRLERQGRSFRVWLDDWANSMERK